MCDTDDQWRPADAAYVARDPRQVALDTAIRALRSICSGSVSITIRPSSDDAVRELTAALAQPAPRECVWQGSRWIESTRRRDGVEVAIYGPHVPAADAAA